MSYRDEFADWLIAHGDAGVGDAEALVKAFAASMGYGGFAAGPTRDELVALAANWLAAA